MRALEHIVEAGALDKVTELSKKVGEVNLYISRLFQNKHENLASNVNTAFRFKIDTRDTHLVEEWVEDDDKFHRVVQAISNKLNESPRACLNWWNQSILILAIAAAEARNRENVPVVEDVCALLDDSIINVIKTYDKIIKKLKEIWMKRSVWHRIGRRISEIWAKLKTLLLGIPNKIIDKISIIQHKVDNDPDLKDRIVDKAKFVISHTISTILMMFSGVQESVIRLIRFAGTATISKTQDKVLRDLVGLMTSKKAQYTIHGFRTFTRPAFTTIGQPLKYTDEPLKTVLDMRKPPCARHSSRFAISTKIRITRRSAAFHWRRSMR